MRLETVTSATAEPVSLGEVKRHLRLSTASTDEGDELVLNGLIVAARQRVEDITNRCLMTQTKKVYFDEWPDTNYFDIPRAPLLGVESTGVIYKDSDSSSITMHSTGDNQWGVDTISEPGRVVLKNNEDWPSETLYDINPISIQFICGYGTTDQGNPAKVPEPLKLGIKLLVGHWFENRENTIVAQTIANIPEGIEALLTPYRDWKF